MIWDSVDDWDDPRITHSQKGSFNKDSCEINITI